MPSRIAQIVKATDELAWCRNQRKQPMVDDVAMLNQVGECDWLSELHRLLYEVS